MTYQNGIMAALRGEKQKQIPFTIYEGFAGDSPREQALYQRGLSVIHRVRSHEIHTPNVRGKTHTRTNEHGRRVKTTVLSTPHGDLSQVTEDIGCTSWTHAHYFKTPDDYKALRFLLRDAVVTDRYAALAKEIAGLGEGCVRDNLCLEPLQTLISHYMGTEAFCFEWMDNRDEVLLLYDALVETARKIYPIAAGSPLPYCNYGGNVTPQIIGREGFRRYYCPHYAEAAEVLHKSGKLLGCHLDADNTVIMDDVAETPLDYIEAFDPGMGPSLTEACAKWPDKAIWINFPSAWHLHTPEQVVRDTAGLIQEGRKAKGFLIGITEDVPAQRLPGLLEAILRAVADCNGTL